MKHESTVLDAIILFDSMLMVGYMILIFKHGVAANERQADDARLLLRIQHHLEQREFLNARHGAIPDETRERLRDTRRMLETTTQMIRHLDHPATLLGVEMQRNAALGVFFGLTTVIFSIVLELVF